MAGHINQRAKHNTFLLLCTGNISRAYFPEYDSVDCKYLVQYGNDWELKSGAETGVSHSSHCSSADGEHGRFVFNCSLVSMRQLLHIFRY